MQNLVFGCGYLGLRVAQRWLGAGVNVHAVTRSPTRASALGAIGITPVVADITVPDLLTDLPSDVDVVLFAVGFDRSRYTDIRDVYVSGLENVINSLKGSIGQFIYISSTGVYGDTAGSWVDEQTPTGPTRPGGRACLEAENLLLASCFADRLTILRLAGIYGPGRIPSQTTIQQRQLSHVPMSGHLNLIHVEDAASVVVQLAALCCYPELFVVSDGFPVLRLEYYQYLQNLLGSSTTPGEQTTGAPPQPRYSGDKRICNRKLVSRLPRPLKFPNYRIGLLDALS